MVSGFINSNFQSFEYSTSRIISRTSEFRISKLRVSNVHNLDVPIFGNSDVPPSDYPTFEIPNLDLFKSTSYELGISEFRNSEFGMLELPRNPDVPSFEIPNSECST